MSWGWDTVNDFCQSGDVGDQGLPCSSMKDRARTRLEATQEHTLEAPSKAVISSYPQLPNLHINGLVHHLLATLQVWLEEPCQGG